MDDKRHELRMLLLDLSRNDSETEISNYVDRLRRIYSDDFRHFYSDIFGIITTIKNNEENRLDLLTLNIGRIFEFVEKNSNDEDFFLKIKKLYDHINLDISRFNYTEKLVSELNGQSLSIKDEMMNLTQKTEKMQREYVTILGIFAAIILAFVSGLVFSTSVLTNVDKLPLCNLIFVMILIALFIFNLLNLLLSFIRQINGIDLSNGSGSIKCLNCVLILMLAVDSVYIFLFKS